MACGILVPWPGIEPVPSSAEARNPNHWTARVLFHHTVTVKELFKNRFEGFPGGAVVKNPPANAGDAGSSPGPGRSHMPWSN